MKLFQEMVFTSFLCGGLILLICAVNKAVDHRYQRMWRYYLWILIGIRLLIPFDFSVEEAPIMLESESIYRLAEGQAGDLAERGEPVSADSGDEGNSDQNSQVRYTGTGSGNRMMQ